MVVVIHIIGSDKHIAMLSSAVIISTFVFTYLKNMIYIQQHLTEFIKKRTMERRLRQGDCFRDISGIETTSLQKIYTVFMKNSNVSYQENEPLCYEDPSDIAVAKIKDLEKKRQTHDRALERLNRAYLYTDMGLSEKEYLQSRQEITQAIQSINEKIKNLHPESSVGEDDMEFLEASCNFLIKKELLSAEPIQWLNFAEHVSSATIHQFLCDIITKIVFYKRRILSIEFKNGIVHRFVYNE
jgi:hypothetical protein